VMGGCKPHDTHERRAGDAHARQLWRGGETVSNGPTYEVRFGKKISQKTEAGQLAGKAEGLRFDVYDSDFEQVTGLGVTIVDIEPQPYGFTCQLPGFGFLRDLFS